MSALRLVVLTIVCLPAVSAQQEGMIPRWQVEEVAASIVENVEAASKVVEALRPKEWVQDGAPEVYVEQHAKLLEEMEATKLAAGALGRNTESLTYAVDAFLWLDRTDALLDSVGAGTRQYFNTAVADLLDSVRLRNTDSIATLKLYIRQLAAHTEEVLKVVHNEAQRCRGDLVTRPQ